ncbi:metallopeptidase family protein [Arthrobacter sp. GCM10027362]|uniref:metallopeptidase family protein n=1 Tax=Arthrobacter sp. GCM10027362 TaxID=3273379 RepID=UPI003640206D
MSIRIANAVPAAGASAVARPFGKRRRNRHGRGLRGELLPAHLPGNRTRSERFEDLVLDSVERLQYLWGERIDAVEFLVADIPPGLEELVASRSPAPLGNVVRARPGAPAVVTIYRKPVEAEARIKAELPEVVHDVVVEQTAELLGMSPEAVDPTYGRTRP